GISEEPDIQATIQPKSCELRSVSEKMSKVLEHAVIHHIRATHRTRSRSTRRHRTWTRRACRSRLGKHSVVAPIALVRGRIARIASRILFGNQKAAGDCHQVSMMRIPWVEQMNFAAGNG